MPREGSGKAKAGTRSRRSLKEQAEDLRRKLAEIEAKEQQKVIERYVVIGRELSVYAERDEAFRKQMDEVLRKAVTNPKERRLLGLASLPSRRAVASTE